MGETEQKSEQQKQDVQIRTETKETEKTERPSLVTERPSLMTGRPSFMSGLQDTGGRTASLDPGMLRAPLLDKLSKLGGILSGDTVVFRKRTFSDIFKGEGSAAYAQLQDAVAEIKKLSARLEEGGDGAFPDMGEAAKALITLGEAANGYYDLHRGNRTTGKGDERKAAALGIRKMVGDIFAILEDQIISDDPGYAEKPVNQKEYAEKYSKATEKRLAGLAAHYRKWAKHFGFQEGNERDKIRDKAALFQPFEEDIRAYEAGHKEKGIKYDPEIRAVIEVYHEYKRKERVLSVLEKDAAVRNKLKDPMSDMIVEHADEFDESKKDLSLSDEEVDENLTADQVAQVEEIDRWFIRNYNNAGMIGRIFAARNHHGEIISSLFRKTKRERLFIYYLIETGQRKSPEVMDVFNSQTGYILSLDRFKKAMLASKFKIISHLTGSYVYMNKLAEAMQINRDYKKLVKGAAMIEEERLKKKKAAASGKEQTGEQKDGEEKKLESHRRECLILFYDANIEHRKLMIRAAKEKDKKKKKQLEENLKENVVVLERLRQALIEADERFGDKLRTRQAIRPNTDLADQNTYAGMVGSATQSAGDMGGSLIDTAGNVSKTLTGKGWGLSGTQLAKANLYGGSISGTGLALCSQTIAACAAIFSFSQNAANMHAGDIGMTVTQIMNSVGNMGISMWRAVESGKYFAGQASKAVEYNKAFEVSRALKIAGIATASITTAIGAYRTISGGLDIRNANNAREYLKKKREKDAGGSPKEQAERERRYEDNLIRLTEKMSRYKTKTAAIDTTAAAITLAGVFVPGLGVIGIGAGIGSAILSAVNLSGVQTDMADQYLQLDLLYDKCLKQAEKDGRKIHDRKAFKEQLRRRLYAAAGYSDCGSAADQIAKKYAVFVLDKLFGPGAATDPEEKKLYIEMIRGFGLPYNEEKKKPDVYHLARKMSGR